MNRVFGLKTALAAVLLTLSVSSSAWADDVITRWNHQALDTVRTQRLGAAGAARLYAMVNAAIYDAVNGISRARYRGRDFALVPPRGAPRRGDKRAAAAAAAHAVLVGLHPDAADPEDPDNPKGLDLDQKLIDDLADLGGGRKVQAGQLWGAWVGEKVVLLRQTDGSSPAETLDGSNDPGRFRADFGSAQYREMTPFAIATPDPYLSEGPPALDSVAYAWALNEVQLLGNAANPNTVFEQVFRFWRGGGGSARPPGEWIKVALVVSEQLGTTESIDDMARLMALMGMAMGDSVIPAWINKSTFLFWRPATAIRNADSDGNDLTVEDEYWNPRNGGIGGSPEHTSGQSTFAGSGSATLAGFYCTDLIAFTFTGDDALPEAGPRTFSSFSAAAEEAGRARMFAGIHFAFSDRAAQDAGRRLANEILTNKLQPLKRGRHADDDDDGDHRGRGHNAPTCPQS